MTYLQNKITIQVYNLIQEHLYKNFWVEAFWVIWIIWNRKISWDYNFQNYIIILINFLQEGPKPNSKPIDEFSNSSNVALSVAKVQMQMPKYYE